MTTNHFDPSQARDFVGAKWDAEIVPQLVEYIRIPNKSPMFDSDWVKHGYMEQAVSLMETWARAQDEKFDIEHQQAALDWHIGMLGTARTDLVVAPETAIPFLPQQVPEGMWERLQAHFAHGATAALIGVPLGNDAEGYTNSAVGFSPSQPPYRYDKQHLVPFGEFIPRYFRWFTDLMHIPLGDFNRGPLEAPSFVVKGERVAPNICYEDLFGEELAARFADPAGAPTILANLSNIGWFGNTIAVDQHLAISRMRALEFQLPMVRATNTGATAIIDHRGQVQARLPAFQQAVLDGPVQGRQGLTPFARWASLFGLWPLIGSALLVCAGAALRRRGGPAP